MSTRSTLVALFFALSSSILFVATAVARPNIVFVMVDDLDVSVFRQALKIGVLPTIQSELIDGGTVFENVFTSQPLCCPSRVTFQTGQYPQNHGVVGNEGGVDGYYERFKASGEKLALATWLKEPGHADGTYRTGFFGKYINGSGTDWYHVPPGWEVWRALIPKTVPQCVYGYSLANTGGTPTTFGSTKDDYQTDKLAELSVEFISSPDPRPFLLVVAPTPPHVEACTDKDPKVHVRTAPRYVDLTTKVSVPDIARPSYNEPEMSDKPAWMQHRVPMTTATVNLRKRDFNDKVAALRPVDDLIKRLLDELRLQKKDQETLVIFTSDNGYQYGTHRLVGKDMFYEESTRVPMLIKAPGQTKPYKEYAWVLNNDWAPTIAAYAQVTPLLTVDGRSFKALLDDPDATSPRQTFLIRRGFNPGTGTPPSSTLPRGEFAMRPYLAVRTRKAALTGDLTGKTVLVYAQSYNYDATGTLHSEELYDLSIDPWQINSLHNSTDPVRITQIEKLKERLLLLKSCIGDDCRWLEDN